MEQRRGLHDLLQIKGFNNMQQILEASYLLSNKFWDMTPCPLGYVAPTLPTALALR
jgi:hypothetical protein